MKGLRERGGEKERLRGRECVCAWGVGWGGEQGAVVLRRETEAVR